jgi:hypothetical protein
VEQEICRLSLHARQSNGKVSTSEIMIDGRTVSALECCEGFKLKINFLSFGVVIASLFSNLLKYFHYKQ